MSIRDRSLVNSNDDTSDLLLEAAMTAARVSGAGLFEQLTSCAAKLLKADVAFISLKIPGDDSRLRTLSLVADGKPQENLLYAPGDTPCWRSLDDALHLSVSHSSSPIQHPLTPDMDARAYSAVPLRKENGDSIGLIAVMSRVLLPAADTTKKLLSILGSRVQAEVLRENLGDYQDHGKDIYRLMFNASLDGLALIDRNGLVVDVNPAVGKLYGRTREEVIGQSPPGFREPKDLEAFRASMRRVLDGETIETGVWLPHKDGSMHPAETRSVRIVYHGEPHVLVIVRDLSEHRQREGELQRSVDLYRAMFDASLDGIAVLDARGNVVDVNPSLLRVDGFAREELVGQFPPTFREPAKHGAHQRYVQSVLEKGAVESEAPLMRKNGGLYMAEMRSVRIDYRGEPHILVVVRDISERRNREHDLQRSEDRYRAVFEGVVDGLALIRADGLIVEVNQAMLELEGFDRDELIGKLPPTYIGDENKIAAHREYVRRVLASERVKREFLFERKDGSNYFAEVRAIRITHNNEPHVLLLIRDITRQKKAKEQSEILEAQLRQAQKMEAIGHLTGGVAHDFNNILTSVLGYVTLARDYVESRADEKLDRYLERAERAGARARDLIAQMLTFSRGQQGERQQVDAIPLVTEALSLLESSLPASIEMQANLPKHLPVLSIDPVHFEQILVNLCINARDAMDGIGHLRVTLSESNPSKTVCSGCHESIDGHYIELAVSDNGPGIDPNIVERIFEPFFTTKDIGKGSGMGLSTVHGIVHDHAGHAVVESELGVGTTMRILLPVSDSTELADVVSSRPNRRKDGAGVSGRVLVVDDNVEVGEYLEDLLSSWGMDVTVFNDAENAKAHIGHHHAGYDLVITDQTMPRVSGLELARYILATAPALPVFLYTGYSESVSEDVARKAGVRAFFPKPLDTGHLNTLIREVLS